MEKAQKRSPRYAGNAPVHVEHAFLMQLKPDVERVLQMRCGVHANDLPDVTQNVLAAAWKMICKGRFCPKPDLPLRDSLFIWLRGICWRQASHHHDLARFRHEVYADRCWNLLLEASDPEQDLFAKQLVEVFKTLPEECQEVLALVIMGNTSQQIAEQLKMPVGTVATRIRRGRKIFVKRMKL